MPSRISSVSGRLTQAPEHPEHGGYRQQQRVLTGRGQCPPAPLPVLPIPTLPAPSESPSRLLPYRAVDGAGRQAGGSGDTEAPQAAQRQRLGGCSPGGWGGLGPTARSRPRSAPPRPDPEGGDGNKYLDFEAKVIRELHPGATWAQGSRAPPVPGREGRDRASDWMERLAVPGASPLPDWLCPSDDLPGPIGEAHGAAPLFSGANRRGGRADLASLGAPRGGPGSLERRSARPSLLATPGNQPGLGGCLAEALTRTLACAVDVGRFSTSDAQVKRFSSVLRACSSKVPSGYLLKGHLPPASRLLCPHCPLCP